MKYFFSGKEISPRDISLTAEGEKELKKASAPRRLHHNQITGGLNSRYEGRL